MNARVNARNADAQRRRWWIGLILLLLLALGLRVWRLTEVPPGLSHDEASNGHDSAAILRGVHRIYFPVGYGHEPLYNYSVALTTLLLGQSIFTLRITTVAWSAIQIAATVALARRWWGRTAALGTAGAYAVSFWALMMARVGLRAPALPALLAASVLAYDHALNPPGSRSGGKRKKAAWTNFALAGALLGASFYTYMASRGMILLYPVTLLGLAIINRRAPRRAWAGTALTTGVAALVGLPLLLYLRAHPGLEQRIAQLGYALTAVRGGDWRPLWHQIIDNLPMLIWRADPRWLYHIGGRPALEPPLALLFIAGLVACLGAAQRPRRQRSAAVMTLVWLAGGLAPAFLAPVEYNTLHAIAAMPPVFLLVGLGLDLGVRGVRRWAAHRPALQRGAAVAGGIALLATGVTTAHAYFVTWGEHRDVRVAYHHHVVALGRTLDGAQINDPLHNPVVITSLYPGEFHDPYTMEVTLRRTNPRQLRWADGRWALFVPREAAQLFVEAQTQPPDVLWQWVREDLTPAVTLTFGEDDIPPWVRGYRWDAPASWVRLTATLRSSVRAQAGDPPPTVVHTPLRTPVTFGAAATLVGYHLLPDDPAPGQTIRLLTAWEIAAPVSEPLALFAHLLDAEGTLIDQDDRLDAPTWQWQAGDRLVQIHELTLGPDADAAGHVIALGWYVRQDVTRLPVQAPGLTGTATRVLLPVAEAAP